MGSCMHCGGRNYCVNGNPQIPAYLNVDWALICETKGQVEAVLHSSANIYMTAMATPSSTAADLEQPTVKWCKQEDRNQPSSARMHVTRRRGVERGRDAGIKIRPRCGECIGCLREDNCGECTACR